jgi:hypothetical protein
MDIAQVKATIRQGSDSAMAAESRLHEVLDRITLVTSLATLTCHDSAHDRVESGIKRLATARAETTTVIGLLTKAAKAADSYAAEL